MQFDEYVHVRENDESSFMRAAWESKNDTVLLHVFADWLEERGDPLAAYIRQAGEMAVKGSSRDKSAKVQLASLKSNVLADRNIGRWQSGWYNSITKSVASARRNSMMVFIREGEQQSRHVREKILVDFDTRVIRWYMEVTNDADRTVSVADRFGVPLRTVPSQFARGYYNFEYTFRASTGDPTPGSAAGDPGYERLLDKTKVTIDELPPEILRRLIVYLVEWTFSRTRIRQSGGFAPGIYIFGWSRRRQDWNRIISLDSHRGQFAIARAVETTRSSASNNLHNGVQDNLATIVIRADSSNSIKVVKLIWAEPIRDSNYMGSTLHATKGGVRDTDWHAAYTDLTKVFGPGYAIYADFVVDNAKAAILTGVVE